MSVPHTGQFIVIKRKITLDHYILYLYLIKKVPFYRYSNFFHPIAFSHPLKQIKFFAYYLSRYALLWSVCILLVQEFHYISSSLISHLFAVLLSLAAKGLSAKSFQGMSELDISNWICSTT